MMRIFFKIILLLLSLCYSAVSVEAFTLDGTVDAISRRAGMVLMQTGTGMKVIEYGDDTKMVNLKDEDDLYIDMKLQIVAEKKDLIYYARELRSLPQIQISHGRTISLDEFEVIINEGDAFYDARQYKDYISGHIPGARHMSSYERGEEEMLFYCFDISCSQNRIVDDIIRDTSLRKIFFKGGVHAWTKAKRPLEAAIDYMENLRKNNEPLIIIDVRSEQEVQQGHIPHAVSIPSEIIAFTRYRFPVYLKAHIFIYGNSGKDRRALNAARIVAGWSYKNVFVLQGGLKEYRLQGFKLTKGDIREDIDFKRAFKAHEIPITTFKEYIESLPDDILILDVRNSDEVEQGRFTKSLNIPLDEIQYRYDEINKSKYVLTHCASGVRARIAYYILKEAGFAVSCLNGYVGFDDLGLYSISDN